jgi:hypothetical protein
MIYSGEWYIDTGGRRWAVDAVDIEARKVRLRLVDRQEIDVSIEDLRADFTFTGVAAERRQRDKGMAKQTLAEAGVACGAARRVGPAIACGAAGGGELGDRLAHSPWWGT